MIFFCRKERKKEKLRKKTQKLKKKPHQRVVRDDQLPSQLSSKRVDVLGIPLLHDLLLVVSGIGSSHHLAARGAPLLGAVGVVDARRVARVFSGLGRGQVDAHGGIGVLDWSVDGALIVVEEKES